MCGVAGQEISRTLYVHGIPISLDECIAHATHAQIVTRYERNYDYS
jgi:hypothetical protein